MKLFKHYVQTTSKGHIVAWCVTSANILTKSYTYILCNIYNTFKKYVRVCVCVLVFEYNM